MPTFNVQRFGLRSFSQLWGNALTGLLGILLVSGAGPFGIEDGAALKSSVRQGMLLSLTADHIGVESAKDTTRPRTIAVKPCNVHATYRNREKAFLPYEPVRDDVVPSLHEFTCRWAVGNDLSIDSTQLPKYVQPIGDSLQLGTDALAYGVEMVQLKKHPSNAQHTLYFVAEVSDSLYYKEITDVYPHHPARPDTVAVRSLRPLEVPQAEAQYIWFEYAKFGTNTQNRVKMKNRWWYARVFTYDTRRGMRHLTGVPIRYEKKKDGELYGVRQLDVRIPEAGIMEVEERLQRGENLTRGMGWNRVIGTHIIDSTAIDR